MNKPSIVAIIGEHLVLRRSGKEFVGLCPFHDDRHPSLSINEDKGVFLCRSCGVGGDVVSFIMKLDSLTFPEAKRALGMTADRQPRPPLTSNRKRAAELAAVWVNEQRAKLNLLIAERMEQRDIADEIGDFELAESFDRELVMLRGFYDALEHPCGAVEMLSLRPVIDALTDGTGATL